MFRIKALNVDSSESSGSDEDSPRITKEAQEEITLSKYNTALKYQRNNQINEALYVFRDITQNDFPKLFDIHKDNSNKSLPKKFSHLNYAVHRNIGLLFYKKGLKSIALDYYLDAAEVDNTDVTLWNRIGNVAIEVENYSLAIDAFQKGLDCNPKHWPCIDSIILLWYAMREDLSCLYHISKAFALDPGYLRGLAYRDKIYKHNKAIKEYYETAYKHLILSDPPLDTEFDESEGSKLIDEAEIIAERITEKYKANLPPSIPPVVPVNKPIQEYTWLAVGQTIIDMYKHLTANKLSLFSPIELNKNIHSVKIGEEQHDQMETESPEKVDEEDVKILENGESVMEVDSITNDNQEDVIKICQDILEEIIEKIDLEIASEEVNEKEEVIVNDVRKEQIELEENIPVESNEIDELVKITSELEKSGEIIPPSLEEAEIQIPNEPMETQNQIEEANLILAAETSSCPKSFEKVEKPTEDAATKDEKSSSDVQSISEDDGPKTNKDSKDLVEIITDKDENPSATDTEGLSATDDPRPPTSTTVAKSKLSLSKQSNRRRRSSLSMLEIWGWHSSKRRNNQVTTSKPKKRANVRDNTIRGALKRVLPEYLCMDTYFNQSNCNSNQQSYEGIVNEAEVLNVYFGTVEEEMDVQQFWEKFAIHCDYKDITNCSDILSLLEYYVPSVAAKWQHKWSQDLIETYCEAYEYYRLYFRHPNVLDQNTCGKKLQTDAEISLLYGELVLDQGIQKYSGKFDQPIKILLPLETEAQVWFVACKPEDWSKNYETFFCRAFYLKILIAINQRKNFDAMDYLRSLIFQLEERGYDENLKIILPNCQYNKVLSIIKFKALLEALERNENLSQIVRLFDEQKFNVVIPILKDTFHHVVKCDQLDSAPCGADRPFQIHVLKECYWFKEEYGNCLLWTVNGLLEAFMNYSQVKDNKEQETLAERWHILISECFAMIEWILKEEGNSILKVLPKETLQQLVETLTDIVSYQADSDNLETTAIPFGTIYPWILLHYILQREEDRGLIKIGTITDRQSVSGSDDDEDDEKGIPPSLMVLFIAHEYLGRRSWCSVNEGELLKFTLDVIMPCFRSPLIERIRDKINKYLEQIFYCLYQHPSKKNNKVRYLVDHNVPPQKLSWNRAQQLYDFYRPDDIPEFDAYKLESISADTEGLLKRVVHLIPSENDPQPLVSEIQPFIDGEVEEMPKLEPTLSYKIIDIYYLLADFYFKNNEFTKAFKYYMLDLCNNPDRIDSWAGMALSRASVMETTINSCEMVVENEFLAKAQTVQICFKQSLKINPSRLMLWIEYGAFVYSVHSFCSRIMKTEADTLSMEKFEILENKKEELLKSALECFEAADTIWQHLADRNKSPDQDERWLHQYMQGKIAEKQGKDPSIYMTHYMKARELLNENNAQYPQKINYNNPQSLAVEALEVYYRIHASILKYLELHETKAILKKDSSVFYKCLNDCANNGFIKPTLTEDVERKRKDEPNKRKRANNDNSSDVIIKKSKLSDENGIIEEKKTEDAQGIMDRLMKQCLEEHSQHATEDVENVEQTRDEHVKTNGTTTEKTNGDIKGSTSPTPRRGSHESTTTTSTQEEDNAASDSSDSSESGSSSTSSDSSSSSSSDSSDDDSEVESRSKASSKASKASKMSVDTTDIPLTKEQIIKIEEQCLKCLELCVNRFPQHYKALYRLAYHYFHRPDETRDLTKCRQLLLGQYKCSDGTFLQGLFSDRKTNNFFNGVWRIPVSEMDRPGSFASHMSRCVTLLMQVLRACNDHRTLLELCLQLKRTPDPEKKYLREAEREQLSQQALSLCLQCLRELLRAVASGKFILTHSSGVNNILNEQPTQQQQTQAMGTAINTDPNPASQLLIDCYRAYQKAQKNLSTKESLFSQILIDVYKQHSPNKPAESYSVEAAVKFCQQRMAANRLATQQANTQNSGNNNQSVNIQAGNTIQRKTVKVSQPVTSTAVSSSSTWSSTWGPGGRPRGRPPNINKFDLPITTSSSSKTKYSNPSMSNPSSNYFPFHPLLMSGLVNNAMTNATSKNTGIDPSAAALSLMMSNYQELLRQYQANIPNFNRELATQELAQTLLSFTTQSPLMSQLAMGSSQTKHSKPKKETLPKPKSNKDSILKAVYGNKEKVSKPKEVPKDPTFKDRPFLSISQITSTSPPKSTSPGKTLQQKLAERQKQISPSKSSVDIISPTSLFPSSSSYISPPPAHTTRTTTMPYQYPVTAHSNPRIPSPLGIPQLPSAISITKKSKVDTFPPPFLPAMPGETIPLLPKLPQISASFVPAPSSASSSALLNLPASVSIAPVGGGKTQTTKLLNYRKPSSSTKPSTGKMATKTPITTASKIRETSEIIVLDDDDD